MSKPMYCLFFSFKGGVGRTSALMNTARFLAKKKKRVLVIDLDLAAPGVDIFDVAYQNDDTDRFSWPSYNPVKYYAYNRKLNDLKKESERKSKAEGFEELIAQEYDTKLRSGYGSGAPQGFVEFALRYQQQRFGERFDPAKAYPDSDAIDVKLEYPSDLREDEEWGKTRYLFKLPSRNVDDGDIVVMRAGNYDAGTLESPTEPYLKGSYDDRQNSLSIRGLTYPFNLDTGDILKSYTEDQQNLSDNPDDVAKSIDEPFFIKYLKKQIETLEVDYVLIDGRPGRDNISTLALDWLCETLVLVFNFNPWNLLGAKQIYNYLHSKDKDSKSKKIRESPPTTLLLATPIPKFARSSNLYSGQHERIREGLPDAINNGNDAGKRLIEIPYADQLLLRDVLISDFAPDDDACSRYSELASLIIEQNLSDITNLIKQIEALTGYQDQKTAYLKSINEYPASIELLYEYGSFLLGHGEIPEATKHLETALAVCNREDSSTANRAFERVVHVSLNKVLQSKYQKLRSSLNRAHDHETLGKFRAILDELGQGILRTNQFIAKSDVVNGTLPYTDTASGARMLWQVGLQKMSIAKGLQFVGRIEPLLSKASEQEAGASSTEGGGVRSKSVDDWLGEALAAFDAVLTVLPRNSDMEQEYGEVNWLLAVSGRRDTTEGFQTAIESYERAVKLRAESGLAQFELGRFRLANGFLSNKVAMPLFERQIPYAIWPDGANSSNWISSGKFGAEIEYSDLEIQGAIKQFASSGRQMMADFFVPFYFGLASIIELLSLRSIPKEETDDANANSMEIETGIIKRGITAFSNTTLLNPQFSPAYLYGALLEFELSKLISENEDETSENTKLRVGIRERRAFYLLEHFIDIELENLLTSACDNPAIPKPSRHIGEKFADIAAIPPKDEREPFFFASTEIDAIVDADSPNKRFELLWLMENLLNLVPFSEILTPDLETKEFGDFVEMIATHHKLIDASD